MSLVKLQIEAVEVEVIVVKEGAVATNVAVATISNQKTEVVEMAEVEVNVTIKMLKVNVAEEIEVVAVEMAYLSASIPRMSKIRLQTSEVEADAAKTNNRITSKE